MYTISDVVEMGDARELILSEIKTEFVLDDAEYVTMPAEEYFNE